VPCRPIIRIMMISYCMSLFSQLLSRLTVEISALQADYYYYSTFLSLYRCLWECRHSLFTPLWTCIHRRRIDCCRSLEGRAYRAVILVQCHSLLHYIYGGMVFLHNKSDHKSLSCKATFMRFVCQTSDRQTQIKRKEPRKDQGPHVQRVRTHKKVAYTLSHVNNQMYQERNDHGNVRCLTQIPGLLYALFYSY